MNAQTPKILIRADAGHLIGTGHIMRCLALAQACQDSGNIIHVATAELPSALATRISAEGILTHWLATTPGGKNDAELTVLLAQRLGVTWVVEDGYNFGADYQRFIRNAGLRLLAIDDYGHAKDYVADLILNQNINANASLYVCRAPETRLLLGTQYALLRREFLRLRPYKRQIPDVARKVLVTLGGSDPDNVTLKVIHSLNQVHIADLEVTIVAGSGNQHLPELQTAVQHSPHMMCLKHNVTNMPELMSWADCAVSAGGSTCWELAFMQVPCILFVLADNQIEVAAGLHAAKAALNLGQPGAMTSAEIAIRLEGLLLSSENRWEMSQYGQELIDGNGAMRVANILANRKIMLRLAQPSDCRLVWEWANSSAVRSQSFTSEPISWEKHQKWYKEKLLDPMTHFYIAVDEDARPIGQLRFQVEHDVAIISISLAPEQRGKGYGAEAIKLGSQQLFESTSVRVIYAFIKPGNDASSHAFMKAGFVSTGIMDIYGYPAFRYVMQRQ